MTTAIRIEHLWKQYHLGVIGHGTLAHDLQSWWARVRGREDPNAQISFLDEDLQAQIEGDRFWALRDINLDVEEGEVLGIIGKNGAGKSTLLKVLSRVTAPTKGNIKIRGRIASLLEVGTGFHPELTGRENVFLNGVVLGMSKTEITKKLDEIIAFSGVEQYVDTPVKRYSSGMRVRLAFAVAAHLEPEILIIDEVLAVGDAEFQKKAIGKMKEVATNQSRTVLFVSHNMAAIQNLCSRVCLIDKGMQAFTGQTQEAIQRYLTADNDKSAIRLHDRTDRTGTGLFRFIDYWLEDKKGKRVGAIHSGQDVVVNISYNAKKAGIDVDIAFRVFSANGINLMSLSNVFSEGGSFSAHEDGVIQISINKFPLPKGEYTFDLKARSKENGWLDVVERAGVLSVVEGDFFGSGKIPKDIRWGVLVSHEFSYH